MAAGRKLYDATLPHVGDQDETSYQPKPVHWKGMSVLETSPFAAFSLMLIATVIRKIGG
jgi:hypothetical protein